MSFRPLLPFCVLLAAYVLTPAGVAAQDFPGRQSLWHGFQRHDFEVEGRQCIVVAPKEVENGRPWIWRARFFGHEPQADLALLARGFHLAYCDVANLFGSPTAVQHWNAFYDYLTEEHRFSQRPALEGMSRGGLIVYSWAAANPERVACIYGDAPVCDFKSWPAGEGKATRSEAAWQTCLKAYSLTEEQALQYNKNPIDNLGPLANAGVPLLHIVGDADVVVPVEENTAILETRYRELGGTIQVIHKPGVGHHPHSLRDPTPIVEFVCAHALGKVAADARAGGGRSRTDHVHFRGQLSNSRLQFERNKKGHVAFLGGSITEMNGYRPMVCENLRRRFPNTEFTFTNAGIASTCSTTGAFRLEADVLSKGNVDLLFVEFAVNDQEDAEHARRECIRGLEGIVRHARQHNPNVDIVISYFLTPGMLDQLQKDETPPAITAHEAVATHYQISTIHLAQEVAEQISAGRISWEKFGGTHPKPFGNAICAGMIDALLNAAWSSEVPLLAAPHPHALPAPLDPLNYASGRFVDPSTASTGTGWRLEVPDWASIPGSKRARFTQTPLLSATKPGAELTLLFDGTAIGAYVVAGPDAGIVEASVDDAPFEQIDLFHRFSKGLHYPRTVMLATDLNPGGHSLRLRVANETRSDGHAVRIMQFVAN